MDLWLGKTGKQDFHIVSIFYIYIDRSLSYALLNVQQRCHLGHALRMK